MRGFSFSGVGGVFSEGGGSATLLRKIIRFEFPGGRGSDPADTT